MPDRTVDLADMLDTGAIQCRVCPRTCVIPPGEQGSCGVRTHHDGELVLESYGRNVSTAIDPIEKKPLFHFAPGSAVLSIATRGCNFACDFCQNHEIALEGTQHCERSLSPATIATQAKERGGIAYTYTEPTIFLEYAYDTMQATGVETYNVFVSNGYMSQETATQLGPHLDAINVDIKGDTEFYRTHCGVPDPAPIYRAIETLADYDVWIEITNLLVPGENTDEDTIHERMAWINETLGPDTPVHFSRFYPNYELTDLPPTPIDTLEEAMTIAREEGLRYVYRRSRRLPRGLTPERFTVAMCLGMKQKVPGVRPAERRSSNAKALRCVNIDSWMAHVRVVASQFQSLVTDGRSESAGLSSSHCSDIRPRPKPWAFALPLL